MLASGCGSLKRGEGKVRERSDFAAQGLDFNAMILFCFVLFCLKVFIMVERIIQVYNSQLRYQESQIVHNNVNSLQQTAPLSPFVGVFK